MTTTNAQVSTASVSVPPTQGTLRVTNSLSHPASIVFSNAKGATACYVIQSRDSFDIDQTFLLTALAVQCEELGTYNIDYMLMSGFLVLEKGSFNIMRDFAHHFPV